MSGAGGWEVLVDFSALVSRKREEAERLRHFDVRDITPSIRDFEYYVQTFREDLSLIGEIRKVDAEGRPLPPREGLKDAAEAGRILEAAGCSALAVVTDPLLGGSKEDLLQVSQAVSFPVLRKDLIVSREQVYESRALGADAIWLQAGVLSASELSELQNVARTLHMDTVLGVCNEEELSRALASQAKILAIGAGVPLLGGGKISEALKLAARVPTSRIVILDALLQAPEDLIRLCGKVDAAFLGATVLAAENIAERAEEFCNVVS